MQVDDLYYIFSEMEESDGSSTTPKLVSLPKLQGIMRRPPPSETDVSLLPLLLPFTAYKNVDMITSMKSFVIDSQLRVPRKCLLLNF